MYCWLWKFDNYYIIACGDPINGTVFDNRFPTNICGCHYCAFYVCCIKATVFSMYEVFELAKWVTFCWINLVTYTTVGYFV